MDAFNIVALILTVFALGFSIFRLTQDRKNLYLIEITILWTAILLGDIYTLLD